MQDAIKLMMFHWGFEASFEEGGNLKITEVSEQFADDITYNQPEGARKRGSAAWASKRKRAIATREQRHNLMRMSRMIESLGYMGHPKWQKVVHATLSAAFPESSGHFDYAKAVGLQTAQLQDLLEAADPGLGREGPDPRGF